MTETYLHWIGCEESTLQYCKSVKQRLIQRGLSNPHVDRLTRTWWRHQKETFSMLLALCKGNSINFDYLLSMMGLKLIHVCKRSTWRMWRSLLWNCSQVNSTDKSTLVHVMASCRQATNHHICQCWPRSMPPYGVTGPQWVDRILFQSTKRD